MGNYLLQSFLDDGRRDHPEKLALIDDQRSISYGELHRDADRIAQVVINLLSNALKFTDSGRVTVSARRAGGEAGAGGSPESLVVAVADTGIGIQEKYLQDVFEKFRQVGDTLTDRPKGTGLGLPICRQIVEHHGGSIRAQSTPGAGSVFSFTLPLAGS